MTKRRANRNRPMQVYTCPSLLRPTYVIPVDVDVNATASILLPSTIAGAPYRVTSFRGTISGFAGNGTITLSLSNGAGGNSVTTRPLSCGGGNQEIVLRNNKFVQHSTNFTPPIMQVSIIGSAHLTGVCFVSFIGSF